ncbi:hypothetical protein Trydic_g377 [Trypoxylus dichotomus]
MDTSGWVPDYSTPQQDEPLPKRRRIRKRKRRPQIISLAESSEVTENHYPVRRIKRPQHLHEQAQDLWSKMEEDSNFKPSNRRRIIPLYGDGIPEKQSIETNDDINVFQADQAVPIDEKQTTTTTEDIPDLRTILKQAGGLSLSEILQQKNLSLSDLLKGEKKAILAITEKPDDPVITEYKNPVEEILPKKNIYNSNYRLSATSRNYISSTESVEHPKKTIYDEGSRRVSIKPNNVIVVDFKPSLLGLSLSPKQSDFPTTTTAKTTTVQVPKLKNKLPITSAKLNNVLKSTTKTLVENKNKVHPTNLPSKAYRINVSELFGLSTTKQKTATDEGPLRMSLDLNSILEKKLQSSIAPPIETTTLETIPEKLKAITAKDEITEVLKDEQTKSYLKRILELRNMTFDDLVELRERGSSQRHLADLFYNKTEEFQPRSDPEKFIDAVTNESQYNNKYEPVINEVKNDVTINNVQFDRQPKSHFPLPLESTDSDGDRYVASVELIEDNNDSKSIEETKDKGKYTVTSFPTYKIELDKKVTEKPSVPLSDTWKSNYPDLFNDFYKRTHQKGIVEDLNDKYFDELRTIDEVENTIAENNHEKLHVDASNELYENRDDNNIFIRLPYGVKHAIFASLMIIGISLAIFLTILLIFKWSQKHKKKLCYHSGFSCSKFKAPILPSGSERRSFRTFMSETLGRKKRYYKQHLQSVSDAIWENDRKPFQ